MGRPFWTPEHGLLTPRSEWAGEGDEERTLLDLLRDLIQENVVNPARGVIENQSQMDSWMAPIDATSRFVGGLVEGEGVRGAMDRAAHLDVRGTRDDGSQDTGRFADVLRNEHGAHPIWAEVADALLMPNPIGAAGKASRMIGLLDLAEMGTGIARRAGNALGIASWGATDMGAARKALVNIDGQNLVNVSLREGGFTLDPRTGVRLTSTGADPGTVRGEGFAVGTRPARSENIPLADIDLSTREGRNAVNADLRKWRNQNADLLADDRYVGGWVDGDHLVMDVTKIITDRDDAIRAGVLANQDTIFDFANNRVIVIKGPDAVKEAAEYKAKLDSVISPAIRRTDSFQHRLDEINARAAQGIDPALWRLPPEPNPRITSYTPQDMAQFTAEYDAAMTRARGNEAALLEWFHVGANGEYANWYYLQKVLDRFIGFTEDPAVGRAAFEMFNDVGAMLSPLAVPASQVRRSLWTVNGIAYGIAPVDLVYPAAYGPNRMKFGHRYSNSTHTPALQRLATEGGDPFGVNAWKTSSYSPAMSGNLGTGVPDMHFARATLHTPDHMRVFVEYLQEHDAWERTFREVYEQTGNRAAAKRAAGDIPQYAGSGTVIGDINAPAGRTGTARALVDHAEIMAGRVGTEAGAYQGNVWVAARQFTGVDSPISLADIILAQIEELSKGSGVPVDDVLRKVFTGQIPLDRVLGPELTQDVLRNSARVQHAIDRARAEGYEVDEDEDLLNLLNLVGGR